MKRFYFLVALLIGLIVAITACGGPASTPQEPAATLLPLPTSPTAKPTEAQPTSTRTSPSSPTPTPIPLEREPTSTPTEVPREMEFKFTFAEDAEGWTFGFADLPADYDQSSFELDSGYRELPSGLKGNGLFLQGHNRSDDLFMFLGKLAEGLGPERRYRVRVTVDLATNVPAGLVGVGGSPGESVYVKAGVSAVEPMVVADEAGWLRINIDKGNQANDGRHMVVLGNLAHPEINGDEYRIKTLGNQDNPIEVVTDTEGRAWLTIGTDSGFEGLTTVYYSRISYLFELAE